MAIVVGDRTSSGGTVITGSPYTDINGMAVARVGDMAICLKHGGPSPIVTGDPSFIIDGQALARHGDYLACGCQLLATKQGTLSVESGGNPAGAQKSAHSVETASPAATAASIMQPSLLNKAPVCEACLLAGKRAGAVFLTR